MSTTDQALSRGGLRGPRHHRTALHGFHHIRVYPATVVSKPWNQRLPKGIATRMERSAMEIDQGAAVLWAFEYESQASTIGLRRSCGRGMFRRGLAGP